MVMTTPARNGTPIETAREASGPEQIRACLEARGWIAELSPGGSDVYHLWAAKGRRVWLVQVRPQGPPSPAVIHPQAFDRESRGFRATPVAAGADGDACWFASVRTGRLLEP